MNKWFDELTELIYVDKHYKPVSVDGVSGTWQLKHRYLAPILFFIFLPLILVCCIIVLLAKGITDFIGLTDRCG